MIKEILHIGDNLEFMKTLKSNSINLIYGDTIEVTFETTCPNEINLNLLNIGAIQKSFIISNQGNNNFSTRTIAFTLTENYVIDQLEFTGLFEPETHLIIDKIQINRKVGENFVNYLNNSKKFSFVGDYDVTNVSLYYYDGIEHFIGHMERNVFEPSKFEFLWNTIQQDTGASTGDIIYIGVKLTDLVGNTNFYNYSFIVDFNLPQVAIKLGYGSEDFQADMTANPLTKLNFIYNEGTEHYYRIINHNNSFTSGWTRFNPQDIDLLGDLGILPSVFRLEYKALDPSGNQGLVSSYNNGYEFGRFSRETSFDYLSFGDNINLNSDYYRDRELRIYNYGQFGDQPLDVLINGFNYGTAYYNAFIYTQFGTENSMDTLVGYSDSLISDNIYSNVNPLNHICWEVDNEELYAVIKHVLLDEDIVILNPLTHNATATMDLSSLYTDDLILPDFVRLKQIYY